MSSRRAAAAGGMRQHCTRLRHGHAGKELGELIDGDAILKVLEKGRNGYPGTSKDPSAAEVRRLAFNDRARGPIDHD